MTDRILEIGEAGLQSTDQQVRKLMDNLVNSEVPGYKSSSAVVRGFPLELEIASRRLESMKPAAESSYFNNAQGSLIKTGNALDIALAADGYFVLSGPWGEGYTRDGRFRLDKDGRLLSVAGNYPVMGLNGPILITPGAAVEINQNGEVLVDNAIVDSLKVVNPESPDALQTLNGSIFRLGDPAVVLVEVESPRVLQGFVEASNVSVIDQMMEMILLERIYGSNTKVIQTRDASLARAMELGRVTQ